MSDEKKQATVLSTGKDAATDSVNTVTSTGGSAWDGVTNLANNLGKTVGDLANDTLTTAKSAFDGVASTASNLINNTGSVVGVGGNSGDKSDENHISKEKLEENKQKLEEKL
ncbi:heat shock cognate protein 80 [Acrasis kona]|uniref:Heat shock cognate protein 80 n=1 Tax=Acrasis kona TaxID=1008807 RepID=A0AAW2ZJ65_9EUKA